MATALILGATGGIGHEVATALHRHGWQINALHRDPTKAVSHGKTPWIHWVKGDAMNAAEVTRAAEGTSVIVHAVNPPGYRNWGRLVIPMIDSSIFLAASTMSIRPMATAQTSSGPYSLKYESRCMLAAIFSVRRMLVSWFMT